jgi:membrane dipeptidase
MPGVGAVVDHIVYAVEKIGADHVGLGSDFDGIAVTPAGLEDISRMGAVDAGLQARGLSGQERANIMGGNLLKLFKTVTG